MARAMDDDELIAAVARGDESALRELFARHDLSWVFRTPSIGPLRLEGWSLDAAAQRVSA